jgi:hypothetical protein
LAQQRAQPTPIPEQRNASSRCAAAGPIARLRGFVVAGTKLKMVRFFAVVFVALALVPGGAHLSELPNKITMPPDQYMVVQQICRGWALFGIVVFAALIFTGAHTLLVRREPTALRLSLTAFLCLAAAQAIFWIFTFPMNVASADWSKIPDHFEAARRQWEYSHAAGAALTLVALFALIGSLLRADPRARARRP